MKTYESERRRIAIYRQYLEARRFRPKLSISAFAREIGIHPSTASKLMLEAIRQKEVVAHGVDSVTSTPLDVLMETDLFDGVTVSHWQDEGAHPRPGMVILCG